MNRSGHPGADAPGPPGRVPADAANAERTDAARISPAHSHTVQAGTSATARGVRRGALTLSLKGRALRHLAAREHSRAELERKLAEHEEEPGQLARVLDDLEAKGFISQERVIESVIHRRAARLGTARIKQELTSKGLDAGAIAPALEALKTTELERARQLWERRFGGERPQDPKEQARQIRFLLARGFSSEVVRKLTG